MNPTSPSPATNAAPAAAAAPAATTPAPPSPDILRFLFDFNLRALHLNVEGFTHAESVVEPKPAGNCANWVLGHILANRSYILKLLDETPLWSEADGEPYERERDAEPFDPATARSWESLVADLERTQDKIRAGIARITPERLAVKKKADDRRILGEQLHFLAFHEGYHAGQLGMLRRLVGKSGAI
jgi:hypothetical protein